MFNVMSETGFCLFSSSCYWHVSWTD